ncbi:hypothetical protein GWE18_23730 [Bradyrhizobium sp. CSA112]|nr:hypothetical protein [Bradyrhizobium sp. CSA112]
MQALETIAATGSLVSLGEAARRTGLHRSTNASQHRCSPIRDAPSAHYSLSGRGVE